MPTTTLFKNEIKHVISPQRVGALLFYRQNGQVTRSTFGHCGSYSTINLSLEHDRSHEAIETAVVSTIFAADKMFGNEFGPYLIAESRS